MLRNGTEADKRSCPRDPRALEELLQDLRIRFNLKARAVNDLRVMLSGPLEWQFVGSERDLADAIGCKPVTASRGAQDLERAGLVVAHHQDGRAKHYRVRAEVIFGDVTFPDDGARQGVLDKPRYRVEFTRDGPKLVPATPDRAHSAQVSAVNSPSDRAHSDKLTALSSPRWNLQLQRFRHLFQSPPFKVEWKRALGALEMDQASFGGSASTSRSSWIARR